MMKGSLAITPAFSHVNRQLQECLRRMGIPHSVLYHCKDLVKARSILLSNALRSEATTFLFVDSDVAPTEEQVELLLHSPKLAEDAAVTGAYLNRSGILAAQPLEKAPFQLGGSPRFIECLGAGLGFSAVLRSSVEAVANKLPLVRDSDVSWYPFFMPEVFSHAEYTNGRDEYLSEDFAFWWQCRQAGVKLWLDTHILAAHLVQRPLTPNEHMEFSAE